MGDYHHRGGPPQGGSDMSWRPALQPHKPPGPQDPEHRTAVTKLAEFVARNGPEFEAITKQKQEGNPRFAFLYPGGPFHEFYVSCVQCEIAKLKAEGYYDNLPQGGLTEQAPPPQVHAPTGDPKKAAIRIQIDQLRSQISDSEANLRAQRDAIPLMKEAQLKQAISEGEQEKINKLLASVALDISPLAALLDAMNGGKCSKEAVSNCKKWILDSCSTDQLREILMMYLLWRVKDPHSNENFRLHILYLINDWAYHCNRKKLDPITQMLSRYVPQMYAFSFESTQDKHMLNKLEKLVGCWEGSKYFNDQCFKQLRNTQQIIANAKGTELAEYAKQANQIEVQLQAMYAGYEQQHKNYAVHIEKRIADLEAELNDTQGRLPIQPLIQPGRRSRFDQHSRNDIDERLQQRPREEELDQTLANQLNSGGGFGRFSKPAPKEEQEPDGDDIDGHPFDEDALQPMLPYYELPAAIMCPLLKMESLTYDTLNPSQLRLPPPIPPSQTLLNAVDAYYRGIKTLDYPRDGNAWERDSLNEFLDRKQRLKQILKDKLKSEDKTLEELITNKMSEVDIKLMKYDMAERAKEIISEKRKHSSHPDIHGIMAPNNQRYDSMSPQPQRTGLRSNSSSRSRSRSRSRERSRTRSRSPGSPKRYKGSLSTSKRRSRSRTYSGSRSPSPSPFYRKTSSRNSDSRSPKRRKRSRSASSSPERPMFGGGGVASTSKRSPSPQRPTFGAPISFKLSDSSSAVENRGAMLMQKMGWKGSGLGANESGIYEPISAGEVRDKTDQFRGLGNKPDQFEAFRKARSSGYHERNFANFLAKQSNERP